MTYALILTADGYDDTQFDYAYYRLREDAVLVDVATPDGGRVAGERGGDRAATLAIADLDRAYDAVVVPGGRAADRLRRHGPSVDCLREQVASDGVVAAVGRGVRPLLSADLIEGRVVTGPPDDRDDVVAAGGRWTDEGVTVDGVLVTAQGTPCLPYFMAATLDNVVIPQTPAAEMRERPSWGAID